MPDLTPAHRDHARRVLVASGYPIGDDVDALERIRRTELLEAMATAIALAEVRGPAGGRTDPTDAEETAYGHGLGQAFSEVLALLDAPNPEASIRHVAARYGVDRDLDGPPGPGARALLAAVESKPTPAGPRGPAADVVLQDDPATADPGDAAARRADRLTWSPGDLQITPPPPDGAP